jgi:hypothetical protein
MKIAGSGSGSISQRHGSTDPDPHQNVMDPQSNTDPQRNTAIRGHLITEAAAGTTGGGRSLIQQSKKVRVKEKTIQKFRVKSQRGKNTC